MTINSSFNEDMRSTSNEVLHDRTLSQKIAISSFNLATCELIEQMKKKLKQNRRKIKAGKRKDETASEY